MVITSRQNPIVRRLRRLATSKGRVQEGLILLEGRNLFFEFIELFSNTDFVFEVVVTPYWLDSYHSVLSNFFVKPIVHVVSYDVLKASLSTVNPDGIAILLPINLLPSFDSLPNFVLALDRIQDPGNLGTLLRTSLAADVDVVWLGSGADPLSTKVLRSSAGSLLRLPFLRFESADDYGVTGLEHALLDAKNSGMQVVATQVPDSSSSIVPYWLLDWTLPTVLVLGNEGSGLHPHILRCCSHFVTLPHSSAVESLNVASAAVPLLLERRRATMSVL